jgi:hypothetical protein
MTTQTGQSTSDFEDWGGDLDAPPCTHCGGDGDCYDGCDPLGDCPDDIHDCHACGGTGYLKDQVIF